MTDDDKIKNLLYNIEYTICGVEDGWLKVDRETLQLCYMLKDLTRPNAEIYKFAEPGYTIKLQ